MKNILKELYETDGCLFKTNLMDDAEYKKALKELAKAEDVLMKTMSYRQKELMDEFITLQYDIS